MSENPQVAYSFRDNLQKITQLRNKVCAFELPTSPELSVIEKYIPALEMYTKYALMLAKHLNWSKDYGVMVSDLELTWRDSFNSGQSYMKN